MLTLLQHSVMLVVATLLAIGPAYCRMQCEAARHSAEISQPSCCHAKTQAPESPEKPAGGCSCEVHPKAIDSRGDLQWDLTSSVLPPMLPQVAFDPWQPAVDSRILVADIRLPVSLHVLKCVWRC